MRSPPGTLHPPAGAHASPSRAGVAARIAAAANIAAAVRPMAHAPMRTLVGMKSDTKELYRTSLVPRRRESPIMAWQVSLTDREGRHELRLARIPGPCGGIGAGSRRKVS